MGSASVSTSVSSCGTSIWLGPVLAANLEDDFLGSCGVASRLGALPFAGLEGDFLGSCGTSVGLGALAAAGLEDDCLTACSSATGSESDAEAFAELRDGSLDGFDGAGSALDGAAAVAAFDAELEAASSEGGVLLDTFRSDSSPPPLREAALSGLGAGSRSLDGFGAKSDWRLLPRCSSFDCFDNFDCFDSRREPAACLEPLELAARLEPASSPLTVWELCRLETPLNPASSSVMLAMLLCSWVSNSSILVPKAIDVGGPCWAKYL
mmetsp:Transcript_85659/g.262092  ORF Transcript_85659/g.262092 Transcript_85659/m.262092 type:complete len:266 (-) Transcript_85659:2031-2828(-)